MPSQAAEAEVRALADAQQQAAAVRAALGV